MAARFMGGMGRLADLLGKGEVGPDEDVDVGVRLLCSVHRSPPSKWCARRDSNPRSQRVRASGSAAELRAQTGIPWQIRGQSRG